jgi:hypothetical protein
VGISITVWLTEEVDVPAILSAQGWLPDETGGAHRPSRTYLAGASPPTRVFSPDIPEEVTALLPGVAWMVGLAMEGVTPTGQRVLSKAATAIARARHGVVEDPQQGVFRTPSGVRRYDKQAASENVTIISMGWWAPGGPLLTRDGIADLYARLERLLPEAVPRRWGLGEPPNHSIAEEGTDALVTFVDNVRDDFIVFKAARPCLDEQLYVQSQWGMHGGHFNRFETTHIRIDIEASVLAQPGWGRQLALTFASVTEAIRPFYAEARLMEMIMAGRSGYDARSQLHPVPPLSWKGLPVSPPLAAALGPPYLEFWPDFPGKRVRDFVIASEEQWAVTQVVYPWDAPPGLSQEFDSHWASVHGGQITRHPSAWPDVWPFTSPDGTVPSIDEGWDRARLLTAMPRTPEPS